MKNRTRNREAIDDPNHALPAHDHVPAERGRHKEGADKNLSPAAIWFRGRGPKMKNNTFKGFKEEVRVGR
jgi:hypothetical protein